MQRKMNSVGSIGSDDVESSPFFEVKEGGNHKSYPSSYKRLVILCVVIATIVVSTVLVFHTVPDAPIGDVRFLVSIF
jgi:hypothetical protein